MSDLVSGSPLPCRDWRVPRTQLVLSLSTTAASYMSWVDAVNGAQKDHCLSYSRVLEPMGWLLGSLTTGERPFAVIQWTSSIIDTLRSLQIAKKTARSQDHLQTLLRRGQYNCINSAPNRLDTPPAPQYPHPLDINNSTKRLSIITATLVQNRARRFLLLACEAFRDGADDRSNAQVYSLASDLFGAALRQRGVEECVAEADDAVKELRCDEGKGYLVEAWGVLMGDGHNNDAENIFELGMRLYGAVEREKRVEGWGESQDENNEDSASR
ncbi:hypothetical protein DOTSEDRAFT_28194 [Dothistroma septosporum NZE10]|uniref:Uncharacterized protein n=1 Tax=Dothistroma septosporum (strain NZE10 / CBS 128990) TaxID=675120 RepID=N1PD79_DOTSN|nr:hypothetical protein DOTSEDRAFT_28194 [Dothistroma septosporum NZE10]